MKFLPRAPPIRRNKVIAETSVYFEGFDKSLFYNYKDGIEMFEYRWTKCVVLTGYYVEK